jgi:hypothetical protein
MFCVKIVQENDDDTQFVSVRSMRILVDTIVEHIRDQGSFVIACYNDMDADNKNDIIRTVVTYAILLVTSLMGVKVKHDGNNMRLESDVPPMLPAQLIAIRHDKFVSEVLEPYRDHISAFLVSQGRRLYEGGPLRSSEFVRLKPDPARRHRPAHH